MKNISGLRLIALYKLLQGFLLIGVSFGIFRLIHAHLDEVAKDFLSKTRLDPNNHQIQFVLEKFINLSPKTIERFGITATFYSVLMMFEGFGLWFEKRWAEYLSIVGTSFFLPWELRELAHHPTLLKFSIILLNLIIVAYLIATILGKKK